MLPGRCAALAITLSTEVRCVPDNPPFATGVVVLGPYRSGTSVTAQVLSALGVDFGPKRYFVPATRFNPGGYFERTDINRANDLLIKSAGQSLALPGDPRELAEKADERAFEIADMNWRTKGRFWGVKDPRLCATLLTWIERRHMDRSHLRIIHVRRGLEAAVRSSMEYDSIRAFCDGTEPGSRKLLARYSELPSWHVD